MIQITIDGSLQTLETLADGTIRLSRQISQKEANLLMQQALGGTDALAKPTAPVAMESRRKPLAVVPVEDQPADKYPAIFRFESREPQIDWVTGKTLKQAQRNADHLAEQKKGCTSVRVYEKHSNATNAIKKIAYHAERQGVEVR